MKKLIRDAVIHYEIRNLVRNKRTGAYAPSKNKKVGKIEKLTTAASVKEIPDHTHLLTAIALKHKKKRNEVEIKIIELKFGDWSAWSNDVY